ncbi:MAG: hypothetical protein IJZ40_06660 [Bacteroidaceae bacterium]|nr:hypothetical protein [Bacteroidaceae bacterium]
MNGTEQLDTYYVYDDYGHLCFVLQPMYQKTADLSLYAFQYKYDERNRCIWKKLSGAEHILYEYNDYDQLVCLVICLIACVAISHLSSL